MLWLKGWSVKTEFPRPLIKSNFSSRQKFHEFVTNECLSSRHKFFIFYFSITFTVTPFTLLVLELISYQVPRGKIRFLWRFWTCRRKVTYRCCTTNGGNPQTICACPRRPGPGRKRTLWTSKIRVSKLSKTYYR